MRRATLSKPTMSLVQDALPCAMGDSAPNSAAKDRYGTSPLSHTKTSTWNALYIGNFRSQPIIRQVRNKGRTIGLFVAFVSYAASSAVGASGDDADADGLGFVRNWPPVMYGQHRESSMKVLFLIACILIQGIAVAQTDENVDLSYTYAEFRFVDIDDRSGDGLQLNGSFNLTENWILVGGITAVSFDGNVDSTLVELGGGYVLPFRDRMDLVSTLRYVSGESDIPGGGRVDDNGFGVSTGLRNRVDSKFEFRGQVNHINMEHDKDTHVELAGDYYITRNFAAGASVKFAGDADSITIGARWFFE